MTQSNIRGHAGEVVVVGLSGDQSRDVSSCRRSAEKSKYTVSIVAFPTGQ